MAYIPLNPLEIAAGKPTKEEIFDKVHNNMESFHADIEALKQVSTLDMFNIRFSGDITNYSLAEIQARVPVFRAPVAATIVQFKAVLLAAATSGSLSLEIDKSIDEGVSWSPLLNSPVTITGNTTGSISGSVDFINAAAQEFEQGDLLRLRITSIKVGQSNFHVHIYAELGGA